MGKGTLKVKRVFTKPDINPYKTVEWEKRTAQIKNDKGAIVFEQKDVKVPKGWSENALTIVASKYFKEHQRSKIRKIGPSSASIFEEHSFFYGQSQDRLHSVIERLNKTSRTLRTFTNTDIEPYGRIERTHLINEQMFHFF